MKALLQKEKNTPAKSLIEIEYYTDPLCCWSWAFEPQWRRLRFEFDGLIAWRYRMAGMLPGWTHFSDPLYSVSRPQQMGPVWMEAEQLSGQPMYNRIWVEDPPASSYPACIAVKCAGLQSAEAEEAYLRCLREAVMLQGKNIAREEVLFETANTLSLEQPHLITLDQFEQDYSNQNGQQAFREDLQKLRFGDISRFPSLILKHEGKQPLLITGYRPYDVLLEALRQLAPDLKPRQKTLDAAEYQKFWGTATEKEIAEALA